MVKKGQMSIEFFILVGGMFLFFVAFLYALQINLSESMKSNNRVEVRDTASSVKDEIALAYSASDGYQRMFNIPSMVAGREFTINLTEGFVYLVTDDEKYAISFPVANVTGNVRIGDNLIRKEHGEVFLN